MIPGLRDSQLLSGLSETHLRELAELSTIRGYGEQEAIFNQGDPATSLYLIAAGNVALVRHCYSVINGEESLITVGVLRVGESLGWSSLVEPQSYTVSARALGEVKLIVLDSAGFKAWTQQSPVVEMLVLRNLNDLLAHRLHRAYDAFPD